jgi:hypothetical protein
MRRKKEIMRGILSKRILLFSLISTLLINVYADSPKKYSFELSNQRRRVDVIDDTTSCLTIDISSMDNGKREFADEPVIGPDGKTIVVLTEKQVERDKTDVGLIVGNISNKSTTNSNILHNISLRNALRVNNVKWLSTDKVQILGDNDTLYTYNIDTGTTETIWGDYHCDWDTNGINRISIFNKTEWMGPLYEKFNDAHLFVNKELRASEELRYNGYWVYPERIRGWDTFEEYKQWLGDLTRYEYSRPPMQAPIIRDRGVALTENHIFARPCFVGDTAWVATFEQVFPLSNYTQVLSSQFVLLDAHEVNENPPLSSHVEVKTVTTAQNSYVPKEFSEFIDLLCTLKTKWNTETSKLELIKEESIAGVSTRSEQKIAEVPIDLSTMTFGTPVFLVTRDNLKWSTYVTGENLMEK